MARIERDSIHGATAHIDRDEAVQAVFDADPRAYWRAHGIMALAGGIAAGAVLVALSNPYPWTGPVAAVLAIGVRAAFLKSEALSEHWRLTERRLLGPGGRIVPLSQIAQARKFLDAVQIVTRAGDKHLIRYQADPAATAATILAARDRRTG